MRICVLMAAFAAWPVLAFAQDATSTTTQTLAAAPPSASTQAPPPAATPAMTSAPAIATTTATTASPPLTAEEQQQAQRAQAFYDSLHRQTGIINVAGGKLTLEIPATLYFIGPEDSRRVIVEVWRNPPSSAEGIEGMIFPAGANPYSDTWGAAVSYSNDGHVSDSDAAHTDYAELLRKMQNATRQQNTYRQQHNYPGISLIGWAEPPHYDAHERKLYWAQALGDGGATASTVNYDIRVLGRSGYLVISFVADIAQLQDIKQIAPTIMTVASFTSGNTYADYREGVDQRAAYGIAGLIAGGAAAAIVQKTGMLALLLAFGKKFIVLIIAGFAALGNFVRRLFGGKKPPESAP